MASTEEPEAVPRGGDGTREQKQRDPKVYAPWYAVPSLRRAVRAIARADRMLARADVVVADSDGDLALINAWFDAGVPPDEIEARINARAQHDHDRQLEELETTLRRMKRRARCQEVQMDAWLRRYAKHEARRRVGRRHSSSSTTVGRARRRACNLHVRGSRRVTSSRGSPDDDPGGEGDDGGDGQGSPREAALA